MACGLGLGAAGLHQRRNGQPPLLLTLHVPLFILNKCLSCVCLPSQVRGNVVCLRTCGVSLMGFSYHQYIPLYSPQQMHAGSVVRLDENPMDEN